MLLINCQLWPKFLLAIEVFVTWGKLKVPKEQKPVKNQLSYQNGQIPAVMPIQCEFIRQSSAALLTCVHAGVSIVEGTIKQ